MLKRLILGAAGLAWLAAVAAGISLLITHANTPGAVAHAAPAEWPAESLIPRAPGRPVMLMVVHPHCPCSRSSAGELARIMAQAPDRSVAHVLFHTPSGAPADWSRTDLWNDVSAIPGVTVSVDEGGREAQRFGIATSGHTLLYDAEGRLQFSGGITASRGHAGDNAGRTAVVNLLLGRPEQRQVTSVFGCSLIDPAGNAGAAVQ